MTRDCKEKIYNQRGISQVRHKSTNSPVWNDLLKVKDLYMCGKCIKTVERPLAWGYITEREIQLPILNM
jgi:hypothetical protein